MNKRILSILGSLSILLTLVCTLSVKRAAPILSSTDSDPSLYFDDDGQAVWNRNGLPFNAMGSNRYTPEFLKAWEESQPTRATWAARKNNKETDAKKGREAINLIRDYTFRFVNDCLSGTIWILDYELPKKKNEYPTKFFFGTNAHVIEDIALDKSNPYQQVLPTTQSKCLKSKSKIVKETDTKRRTPFHFIPDLWDIREKGFEPLDEKNNVEKWEDKENEPPYFYYETDNVKLVYVATDFAGNWKKPTRGTCQKNIKEYISDFAVIEIDFKTPDIARKMTRGFHNKYNFQRGKRKNKAIDFFSQPLMSRKNNREMYEESIDIFLVGYPKNGLKGYSTGSFNLGTRQTSKLTYIRGPHMIKDKDRDEIIGHTNVCYWNASITSFGTDRLLRGVEILLEYEPLEEGSSGSLTTDGFKNAIGVKSRHWETMSTITILRSPEIRYENKIIIPEYDLIEGIANNAKSKSYMDSIVNYILKDGRKTHLSEMRKWGTKNSEANKLLKDRRTGRQIVSSIKKKKNRKKLSIKQ